MKATISWRRERRAASSSSRQWRRPAKERQGGQTGGTRLGLAGGGKVAALPETQAADRRHGPWLRAKVQKGWP